MQKSVQMSIVLLCLIFFITCSMSNNKSMAGKWKLIKEKSTDLASWRYAVPQIEIRENNGNIEILRNWYRGKNVAYVDSITFAPGGGTNKIPVDSPIWLPNWYMGVLSKVGSEKVVRGEWKKVGKSLAVQVQGVVEASQGDATIKTGYEYKLSRDGATLTVTEKRSTRPSPIVLVFNRIIE